MFLMIKFNLCALKRPIIKGFANIKPYNPVFNFLIFFFFFSFIFFFFFLGKVLGEIFKAKFKHPESTIFVEQGF
jgi:hypothetical protein